MISLIIINLFRPEDRRKILIFKDAYPHITIHFVFYTDNKISKKSKTKYSDWCNKHGFEYSIGTPNQKWFN